MRALRRRAGRTRTGRLDLETRATGSDAEQAAVALADLLAAGVPDTPGAGRSGASRGRHAQTRKPQTGWIPAAERLRDPPSGEIMRVWIDRSDDSRHYVPDDTHSPG